MKTVDSESATARSLWPMRALDRDGTTNAATSMVQLKTLFAMGTASLLAMCSQVI